MKFIGTVTCERDAIAKKKLRLKYPTQDLNSCMDPEKNTEKDSGSS